MLPSPVSFSKRRAFYRNTAIPRAQRRYLDVLLSRARVTNLGFLLLVFLAAISLLCNLFFISSARTSHQHSFAGLLATISRKADIRGLKHLIIVPGHAIWKGMDPEFRLREDQWILEPYQQGGGRVAAFFAHILQG